MCMFFVLSTVLTLQPRLSVSVRRQSLANWEDGSETEMQSHDAGHNNS